MFSGIKIYDCLILPPGYPACPVKTAHSPTLFVYTRIYVRAPIRPHGCISAAWITHSCSLISLCHAHDVTECLYASYTITYASSSLHSLIIVFTVTMSNSAEFLCTLNDQRVKTTLHVHRLWPQRGYFSRVIVIYMYQSVKRWIISFDCLSIAKYVLGD